MKKFIALLLAMLMALSLVACGGSDEGNAEQPATNEPKASGIKLGISNGYYGNTWRAQYVEDMEAYCEELKADGTLESYTLLNSTGDVTEELNNINSLIRR